jgi:hypothetical protein
MSAKKAQTATKDKSASITVRLDPKLKYGLEILARKQYRNLSSLVEWALNKALNDPNDGLPFLNEIWDFDETDRFINLANHSPELLTFDEQKLWRLLKDYCEEYSYQRGSYIDIEKARTNWKILLDVAEGKADKSVLLAANKDAEKSKVFVEEFEDEIPF